MGEMKDSGVEWIGEIPKDWTIVSTKRFFRNAKRVVGNEVDSYERLALTMKGVVKRDKEDSDGLQPEKFEGYQIIRKNELVFKLIDLENVKTSRVGLSSYTGLVSPAYIVLTNEIEDNRFYYYWFMFLYYNEVFNHLGGNGVRSALNAKDLLEMPIVSLAENTRCYIANYLDKKCVAIDAIIEKQQKIIEKLKEYRQSVIAEAVTKGLNPNVEMKDSGIEFLGKVPSHWEVIKFGKCINIKSNLVPPEEYGDYPQISPDCIEKHSGKLLSYKTVQDSGVISWNHLFFEGQIIYSKIRPLLNKVTQTSHTG